MDPVPPRAPPAQALVASEAVEAIRMSGVGLRVSETGSIETGDSSSSRRRSGRSPTVSSE